MTPFKDLNFPNPVEKGTDLFDREIQLRLIQQTLRSNTRRPVVIMGERVMGKTSLLNVAIEWATGTGSFAVLQLPHVRTREEFEEEILEGMAGQSGTSLYQLGLRDEAGRLRLATVTEFGRIANGLAAASAGPTFLLCLEELDSMLLKSDDDATANQILDFILHVIASPAVPIRFIFTMTRTAPQILRSDASPFLSAARIACLEPWTFDESTDFVTALLNGFATLDRRAEELFFAAAGGHPYLIKAILNALQSQQPSPGTITAEQIAAAIAATMTSPEVDFTLGNIAKVHFCEEEIQVLRRAAIDASGRVDMTQLPEPLHRWTTAVEELHRRRYLRPDGAGGYRPAFGLLGTWLVSKPWTRASALDVRIDDRLDNEAAATLVVDEQRGRVFLGTREINMSAQEYRFLRYLAERAGSVVDRFTIIAEVWPGEVVAGGIRDDRLDTLVHRLRDQIGADASTYVQTRRGRGYYANPEYVRRIAATNG